MKINNEHAIDIRLDFLTDLHIAEHRIDGMIVTMAECCRSCCETRSFSNAEEICEHYHIGNSDMRDTISRVVDAIDGKL